MLVSFIIPAHNEELQLPRTLSAIGTTAARLAIDHEIIVADDASTDRTPLLSRDMGATVVTHERRQIAATRNLGARAARGEVFFFIDADTTVNERSVGQALDALTRGAAGGGGPVRFDGVVPVYARALLPTLNVLFRMAQLAGGCFFFCTRDAFHRSGGWDESLYASEEITFAAALKKVGRFEIVREPVQTSGRKLRTHSGGEILNILLKGAFSRALMGNRLVKSREGLELWYGPRRKDPGEP